MRGTRRTLTTAAMVVLAATVLAPVAAVAAPGPVAPAFEDVQVWADTAPAATVLIVVAQLPTATPLPAVVRMPLPKGAKVTWAGELSSRGPQSDIQRTPKTVQGSGGQAVEITAQKSHLLQYEADLPASTAGQGGVRTARLDWVQSVSVGELHFAYKMPAGATRVQTQPPYVGAPETNTAGESLYVLGTRKLTLGAALPTSVTYVPGTATTPSTSAATGGATSTVNPVLVVLIVLLALVLLALALVLTRRRPPGDSEDLDDGVIPAEDTSDDEPERPADEAEPASPAHSDDPPADR